MHIRFRYALLPVSEFPGSFAAGMVVGLKIRRFYRLVGLSVGW